MDKIWYRNPSKSEVIGCCGGDEKKMTTQNRQKSNVKKKSPKKPILVWGAISLENAIGLT